MKTLLLLTLLAAFSSDPSASKKVEVDLTQDAQITLQSVQDGQEYRLLLELTSPTWELSQADPCEVFLTVDREREPVPLPCRVTRSTEIISPSRHAHYITEFVTVSGRELAKALYASSAKMKIGHYEVEISAENLKQLRPTKSEP